MCLVVLLHRVTRSVPVIVLGNREEDYQRGGLPPRLLDGPVAAVAGIDPVAGGTWLGSNARGVIVAVTNRRKSDLPEKPRSRGLLARDLLLSENATVAANRAARELDTGQYFGCNILCVDASSALVVHGGDWLRVQALPSGGHVLSNRDVNDPADRRVVFTRDLLARESLGEQSSAIEALKRLSGSPEPADAPLCFRRDSRGTVSASIIAVPEERERAVYLHAQGPPDRTAFEDVSPLFRSIFTSSRTS